MVFRIYRQFSESRGLRVAPHSLYPVFHVYNTHYLIVVWWFQPFHFIFICVQCKVVYTKYTGRFPGCAMLGALVIDSSWLPLITIEINYRPKLDVINHFTFVIIGFLVCSRVLRVSEGFACPLCLSLSLSLSPDIIRFQYIQWFGVFRYSDFLRGFSVGFLLLQPAFGRSLFWTPFNGVQ